MKESERNITRGKAKREEIRYQQSAFGSSSEFTPPKVKPPNYQFPPFPSHSNRRIFASSINAKNPPPVVLPSCDCWSPERISESLIAAAEADEEVTEILAEEQGQHLQSASPNAILDTALSSEDIEAYSVVDEDNPTEPLL